MNWRFEELVYKLFGCWPMQRPFYVENRNDFVCRVHSMCHTGETFLAQIWVSRGLRARGFEVLWTVNYELHRSTVSMALSSKPITKQQSEDSLTNYLISQLTRNCADSVIVQILWMCSDILCQTVSISLQYSLKHSVIVNMGTPWPVFGLISSSLWLWSWEWQYWWWWWRSS